MCAQGMQQGLPVRRLCQPHQHLVRDGHHVVAPRLPRARGGRSPRRIGLILGGTGRVRQHVLLPINPSAKGLDTYSGLTWHWGLGIVAGH